MCERLLDDGHEVVALNNKRHEHQARSINATRTTPRIALLKKHWIRPGSAQHGRRAASTEVSSQRRSELPVVRRGSRGCPRGLAECA